MSHLTVLSFGGGQDSTAILLKLLHDQEWREAYAPNDLIVVMSDTGDEWPETYENVERMRSLCAVQGVPFALITPDMGYHSDKWRSLPEFYDRTKTVGSKRYYKSCTDNLKIKPIYGFLADHVRVAYGCSGRHHKIFKGKAPLVEFSDRYGPITVLLGIAAGEERRVAKRSKLAKWMRCAIDFRYPLIDHQMDRAACQECIANLGEEVPIPSNCMRCPFMDERELLHLAYNRPDILEDWKRQERAKLRNYEQRGYEPEKNLGVWCKTVKENGEVRPMTLDDVLEQAQEKFGHMTPEQLAEHRFSHGHCVASAW